MFYTNLLQIRTKIITLTDVHISFLNHYISGLQQKYSLLIFIFSKHSFYSTLIYCRTYITNKIFVMLYSWKILKLCEVGEAVTLLSCFSSDLPDECCGSTSDYLEISPCHVLFSSLFSPHRRELFKQIDSYRFDHNIYTHYFYLLIKTKTNFCYKTKL